jgi:hypothetical protein
MVYNNKRKKYDDHSVDAADVNFELQASNKPPSPKKTRKAEPEPLPKKRELESAKDLMPRQKKSTPAALESKSLPAPKKMPPPKKTSSAAARSILSNPSAAILPPIIQKKSFVRETSNKIFKCELLYTPSPIMTKIAEDSYMKDLPYSSSESSSSSGSDSDSSSESSSSSSSGSDSDSSPESSSSSSSGSDSDSSPEPDYSSEDFYSDNAPTPKFTTFATRWIDLVNEVNHIEFEPADPKTPDKYYVYRKERGKKNPECDNLMLEWSPAELRQNRPHPVWGNSPSDNPNVPILELAPDYYSVSYLIFVDQKKEAIAKEKAKYPEKPVWKIVSEMDNDDIKEALVPKKFEAAYQYFTNQQVGINNRRMKEMRKKKMQITRKKGVVQGNHKKTTV